MLKTFEDSKLYYLILRIHSLKYLKIYDIDMGYGNNDIFVCCKDSIPITK